MMKTEQAKRWTRNAEVALVVAVALVVLIAYAISR